MTWKPYTEDILSLLPDICRSDRHVWRTCSPLICFDIVEYHLLDRVMRQFGFNLTIPLPCSTSDSLHRIDRRGAKNKNYVKIHAKYLEEWNKREDRVVSDTFARGQTATLDAYLSWYRTITKLIITPPDQERPSIKYQPATNEFVLSETVAEVVSKCTHVEETTFDLPYDKALELAMHTLRSLASSCTETLHKVGKAYMLHDLGVTTSTATPTSTAATPTATPVSTTSTPITTTPPPPQCTPLLPPTSPLTSIISPYTTLSPSSLSLIYESPPPQSSTPLLPLTYKRRSRTTSSTISELSPITEVDEYSFGSSEHLSKKHRGS